jgi:hypothetical protein
MSCAMLSRRTISSSSKSVRGTPLSVCELPLSTPADGLPVRGFLGTVDSYESPPRYFLYRHLHFTFLYNDDQVTSLLCALSSSVLLSRPCLTRLVDYFRKRHRRSAPSVRA